MTFIFCLVMELSSTSIHCKSGCNLVFLCVSFCALSKVNYSELLLIGWDVVGIVAIKARRTRFTDSGVEKT